MTKNWYCDLIRNLGVPYPCRWRKLTKLHSPAAGILQSREYGHTDEFNCGIWFGRLVLEDRLLHRPKEDDSLHVHPKVQWVVRSCELYWWQFMYKVAWPSQKVSSSCSPSKVALRRCDACFHRILSHFLILSETALPCYGTRRIQLQG